MEIAYIILGLCMGVSIGWLLQMNRSNKQVDRRVKEKIQELKAEAVEETTRRVEREVRDELADEVRDELTKRYETTIVEEAEVKAKRIKSEAEDDAAKIKRDSENEAQDILIEARRKAEEEAAEKRAELDKVEQRLSQREQGVDQRQEKLEGREDELEDRAQQIEKREREVANLAESLQEKEASIVARLEKVADLSRDEARAELMERLTGDAKIEAAKKVREIEEEAMEEADRKAKKVLSVAIQRWAGEYVVERTVNVVQLPSDDLKGRIIGREGRNIRAFEAATGIDVIIDDTPEAVIVSGFDPVRREIARLSLEKLISDGRIHPSRIEEIVEKTGEEVWANIKDYGERAAFELGIHGMHVDLIKLLGRLRYRTSYGQNMWSHSIETGYLCGLMAAELGVNEKLARRAGLLHDIGKALTHEQEGSHAVIGAEIARKCGEHEIVRNAIAAHHNDEPQNSVIAHLVIAADALSGARPGARREILETYVKRLEDLERISKEFAGVENSYAVQAGREIRVIVENSRVNDDQAFVLSRDIAKKIEDELTYPGQIKVCVIRETRAVEYAK
jgi:ribonuclease Y